MYHCSQLAIAIRGEQWLHDASSRCIRTLHDVLEQPKSCFHTNFRFESVVGFVIENQGNQNQNPPVENA